MKKILDSLFSMQLTVVLLMMFALSSAIATFIENDYGTIAARVAIYEAHWFEVLLVLLGVNLMGSLVVNKLLKRKKYALFLFHISFIVILLGSGITRYISFEGMMHIREGKASNMIISSKTYLTAYYDDGTAVYSDRGAMLMSGYGMKAPDLNLKTPEGNVSIETLGFVPNASLVISQVEGGGPIVSLFTMNEAGRQTMVLIDGESKQSGNLSIGLNNKNPEQNQLNLLVENDSLFVLPTDTLFITMMGSEEKVFIEPGKKAPFVPMQLYSIGEERLVMRSFEPSGEMWPIASDGKMQQGSGLDAVILRVTLDNTSKEIYAMGSRGIIGDGNKFELNGKALTLKYGAVPIDIPFFIQLNEFILDRYPGSNSPSSYASEVTLIDKDNSQEFDYRIFMNHILNYKGYRFYQSSYDTDEKGTVLSVNYDGLGTMVSYIGYALMILGMLWALISKKTRFRYLLNEITKTGNKKMKMLSLILILIAFVPMQELLAQEKAIINGVAVDVVSEEHAEKFGELMVLGLKDRLGPMNTLTGQFLRKFTGKSSFEGLSSDQVVVGIISDPGKWQTVPMLKIGNAKLREQLNIEGKYASFSDFFNFNQQNSYLISEDVKRAHQKKSIDQSKYDKELIKADEKVNIFYLIYTHGYMKFFPNTTDPEGTWYAPADKLSGIPEADSNFVKNVIPMYVESLREAFQTGNYEGADEMLKAIGLYQQKYAAEVLPSKNQQSIEILYNKVEIFEKLFKYYGILGMVFLILIFGNLVNPKFKIAFLKKTLIGIIGVLFVFQTLGFAARWYFSGYAPLSNGFESMIFIAWTSMLGGFLFSRRSIIALAGTTVLASLTLFVAHLNWMNPEVTNLVPVLKSIWLTIHVAVIVSSYAFLGMGMILGLFNLFLMIFQNKNNLKIFNLTIREISLTAEATITIGLYMLTIGTFLGGVWANESWGRYWGWDPKETWALVTILVYGIIVHLSFIPGLMGRYIFNAMSVVGFSSVLMTYFGVNYYLSGLHSYAAGDPVPIPMFVYYAIASLMVILIFAYINNSKMKTYMNSLPQKDKIQAGEL